MMETPEDISQRVDAEREARVEDATQRAVWFDRELRQIHPDLRLVFVPPAVCTSGLTPGRYHIRFINDRGPDAYFPLYGDDGEFVEPHGGILEQLKAQDMSKDRNLEDLIRFEADREKAKEKEAEAYRAQLREVGRELLKHYGSTSVSFAARS